MPEVVITNVSRSIEREETVSAYVGDCVLIDRPNNSYPWLRADRIEVTYRLEPDVRAVMVKVHGPLLYSSKTVAEPSCEFWYDNGRDIHGVREAPQWVRDFVDEHRPEDW